MTPIQTVHTWYETHDQDLVHENADWHVCSTFPLAGIYKGRAAIYGDFFAKLLPMFAEFSAKPDRTIADGEDVIVIGRYVGRVAATSPEFSAPFTHIWSVSQGHITGVVQHAETGIIDRAFAQAAI